MKSRFLHLMMCGVFSAAAVACGDKDKGGDLNPPGHDDKTEISVTLVSSVKSVTLSFDTPNAEALAFTWEMKDKNGNAVDGTYTFEMGLKGENFANAYTETVGASETCRVAFTHKQLNELIEEEWAGALGDDRSFEFRVTGKPAGEDAVESNKTEVRITSYRGDGTMLYIIGFATENGWKNDQMTAMPSTGAGTYSWTGMLRPGDMKFMTALGSWDNYYSKGEEEGSLLFNDESDVKFIIVEKAVYTIDINITALTVSIVKQENSEMPLDRLWIFGTATSSGWNAKGAQSMTDKENGILEWEGTLNEGEFRFMICEEYFYPAIGMGTDASTLKFFYDEDTEAAVNFTNTVAARYKVEVDTENLTIAVNQIGGAAFYDKVWLIGGASPGGWSWDNLVAMTQDSENINKFTYTGMLNEGELKFPVEFNDSWSGKFILAESASAAFPPAGESFEIRTSGSKDYKWNVPATGNYSIEIIITSATAANVTIIPQD